VLALEPFERGPWLTRNHFWLTATHENVRVYQLSTTGLWQRKGHAGIRKAVINDDQYGDLADTTPPKPQHFAGTIRA
jgi:hypothetical protein